MTLSPLQNGKRDISYEVLTVVHTEFDKVTHFQCGEVDQSILDFSWMIADPFFPL